MVPKDTKVKGPLGMVSKGMSIYLYMQQNCLLHIWLILRVYVLTI